MAETKKQPGIRKDKEAFDPEYRHAWFDRYKASIKFDGKLSCSGAFDTYERARQDINSFKDIKVPGGGSSLVEKLNAMIATDAGGKAKASIATALANSAAVTKDVRDQFTKDVTDLNTLLSAPKPQFHPGEIGGYLLARKGEALDAIKSQHNKAKDDLTALFDTDQFKENLKASGLGYDDNNIPGLKDEMLAALDKTNKEELEKLEKTINDDANKLFQASRDNFYRLSYLGYKYNAHKTMQQIILDNTPETENLQAGATGLVIGESELNFTNVDPNKFKSFDTINHGVITAFDRTIEHTENGFRMRLDNRWNSEETILEDLTSLCDSVRACGKDKITITINNPDEETGKNHAQLAFEAAVNAGFDPKKITIKLGDKPVMSYDDKGELNKDSDLFKEHGSKLNYILGKAKKIEESVKKFVEGKESTTKVRDALNDMRNSQTGTTTQPSPNTTGTTPR